MARTLGSPLLSSPTFNLSANLGHPAFSHIPNPATCPRLGPCFYNTPGAVTHPQKPHSRDELRPEGGSGPRGRTGQLAPEAPGSTPHLAPARSRGLRSVRTPASAVAKEGRDKGTERSPIPSPAQTSPSALPIDHASSALRERAGCHNLRSAPQSACV